MCILVVITAGMVFIFRPKGGTTEYTLLSNKVEGLQSNLSKIESNLKEDFRINREENSAIAKDNRTELNQSLKDFKSDLTETLKTITGQNQRALEKLNATLEEKVNALMDKTDMNHKANREEQAKSLKEFSESNVIQLEKINTQTEKKLEQMRETVDEKLQKTLNERLGQSFELVSKQLESVQKGLGEMQTLAQDVGGLKKVLSNVKMRGGIGEVQLAMLLEQVLAPEQYEANVKTRQGSSDVVEFAIKLPGRDDANSVVYLPVDAKFPKEVYEQLTEAYDTSDPALIDTASKKLETVIKGMAKDIRDKYIDPPNTTDFGIMFLPFEGIYGEVVRRASLLEQLQREYKVIVTGPTTLAAILNSLQMGFRTLALQKRSSEVWNILGAVKKEFESFGGMLEKAQRNITSAGNTIEELMGKRTRAITRKLKEVQALPSSESQKILPEISSPEIIDDEPDDNE